MHGVLASSADWVFLGKNKSLALMLHDAGYDVWLGNARGNINSKKHVKYLPEEPIFWSFSWHEIGVIDIPNMIDYILNVTNKRALYYFGHSQGTTSFFVMLSEKPEYNSKIRCMHALAPVAFMGRVKNIVMRLVAGYWKEIIALLTSTGSYEFLPNHPITVAVSKLVCATVLENHEGFCPNMFFLIGGYSKEQMNASIMPELMEIIPAGASVYQLAHYAQEMLSKRFCKYDYGNDLNLKKYGQIEPPDYVISRVKVPVVLHYSHNDLLSHPVDVADLAQGLGRKPTLNLVKDPMFNHFDYTWAKHANELLYIPIIRSLKKF